MMAHHKRKGPRKHGAKAAAGRFHDPDDAAHGGSWRAIAKQRAECAEIAEQTEEPEPETRV